MTVPFLMLAAQNLSWPVTVFLLALLLVLGWPWLLAGWALWRLRGARPAGGIGRAYLLACYSVSVQLNAAHVRGERLFPFVHFVVATQAVGLYAGLHLLLRWRSLPVGVSVGSVLVVTWLAYRYVGAAVDQLYASPFGKPVVSRG